MGQPLPAGSPCPSSSAEGEALLCRVRELGLRLAREADDNERMGCLSHETGALLVATGLVHCLIPASVSGRGGVVTVAEVLTAVEELAYWDASAAWAARALMAETAIAANQLPREVSRGLFTGPRAAIVAGASPEQSGSARRSEDGSLRLSGRWRFLPGSDLATHFSLAARVEGTDDIVACVVPSGSVRLLPNRELVGLVAAGTSDVEAHEIPVRPQFTFDLAGLATRQSLEAADVRPNLLAALNHGAWSQGLTRRLLDEAGRLASRVTQAGAADVSDEFVSSFSAWHTRSRATGCLLFATWAGVDDVIGRNDDVPERDIVEIHLLTCAASQNAVEVAELLRRFAGGRVMRRGLYQRLFQDAHAGALHRSVSYQSRQAWGRRLIVQCGERGSTGDVRQLDRPTSTSGERAQP